MLLWFSGFCTGDATVTVGKTVVGDDDTPKTNSVLWTWVLAAFEMLLQRQGPGLSPLTVSCCPQSNCKETESVCYNFAFGWGQAGNYMQSVIKWWFTVINQGKSQICFLWSQIYCCVHTKTLILNRNLLTYRVQPEPRRSEKDQK